MTEERAVNYECREGGGLTESRYTGGMEFG